MSIDAPGFVRQQCIAKKCGVFFYVPIHVDTQARAHKYREVWCPGCGSPFVWRRSEADELREKVARLESDLAEQRERRDANWRLAEQRARTVAYWKGIAHRKSKH